MKTQRKLQVGDVIKSDRLIYATEDSGNIPPWELYDKKTYLVKSTKRWTTKNGVRHEKDIVEDLAHYDETRKNSEFVVISAYMGGGSTGRDSYPDGWEVTVKRLDKNRKYNPDGEEIYFYQEGHGGCFTDSIVMPNDAFTITGKLTKKVDFV